MMQGDNGERSIIDLALMEQSVDQIYSLLAEASQAILDIYQYGHFNIERKHDNSPVTEADLQSNVIITEGLKKLFSHIPIISEEATIQDYKERINWEWLWLLDPLDGTKEFVKHTDEFTINLALIHDHKVVAGFLYIPIQNEMYFAIQGKGAFQYKADGHHLRLSVSNFTLDQKNIRVVISKNHKDQATQSYIDVLNEPILIEKGSAIKFVSIAKGETDYYPRMIHIMEWDTAAGQILIEEAGGQLVEATSGKSLRYNKPTMVNPYFIASGKIL